MDLQKQTPDIFANLAQYNAESVFFCIGSQIEGYSDYTCEDEQSYHTRWTRRYQTRRTHNLVHLRIRRPCPPASIFRPGAMLLINPCTDSSAFEPSPREGSWVCWS
ncbi:hypothetical protein BDZ94DRAFT_1252866 [Collybia nuda]|uniref:Uncharacterized protein n=1 Tax=Collybia nuda TaxID=64659 RepID=A0A9P5YB85_9AGAR|nr:hypothetical protein BDZ94DRAFT_1252866 [Collybia nuda]